MNERHRAKSGFSYDAKNHVNAITHVPCIKYYDDNGGVFNCHGSSTAPVPLLIGSLVIPTPSSLVFRTIPVTSATIGPMMKSCKTKEALFLHGSHWLRSLF